MIPRNLHFAWLQGWDKLPDKLKPFVQSVIDKNPTWTVYKWDELLMREELKNLGQQYLDKFDSFKLLHAKIDFFRYASLVSKGGASIDTDIMALRGFDSLPNINTSDLIVSEKPHHKSMNNATILSSKNNPVLKYLIDNIDTTPCKSHESNYQCIQRTTGPSAFNKILKPFKDQITVLPKVYLEPCSSLDTYCSPDPNLTVVNHLHELSWLKPWHKNVIKVYFEAKHYRYQILFGIIILILFFIILRKTNH